MELEDVTLALVVIGALDVDTVVALAGGVGTPLMGGVVPFEGMGKLPLPGAPPIHTPFHAATEPFLSSVPVTEDKKVH